MSLAYLEKNGELYCEELKDLYILGELPTVIDPLSISNTDERLIDSLKTHLGIYTNEERYYIFIQLEFCDENDSKQKIQMEVRFDSIYQNIKDHKVAAKKLKVVLKEGAFTLFLDKHGNNYCSTLYIYNVPTKIFGGDRVARRVIEKAYPVDKKSLIVDLLEPWRDFPIINQVSFELLRRGDERATFAARDLIKNNLNAFVHLPAEARQIMKSIGLVN